MVRPTVFGSGSAKVREAGDMEELSSLLRAEQ